MCVTTHSTQHSIECWKKHVAEMNEAHETLRASLGYLHMTGIMFELMSDADSKKTDHFPILYQSTNTEDRDCLGPYLKEFGPSDATHECKRCKVKGCLGHYGLFEFPFERPENLKESATLQRERVMIFHPGFLTRLRLILKCVCTQCYRIRVSEDDPLVKPKLARILQAPLSLRLPMLFDLTGKNKVRECVKCVHKDSTQKRNLTCAQNEEIFPATAEGDVKIKYTSSKVSRASKGEKKDPLPADVVSLKPRTVYNGLTAMLPGEFDLLGMSKKDVAAMFKTSMLVIPARYRPKSKTMRNEDFTVIISRIITACAKYSASDEPVSNKLRIELFKAVDKYEEIWRDIARSKNGLVRNDLYSKRPEESARATQIPSARDRHDFTHIGVSSNISEELTKVELVTSDNIDRLQGLVFQGKVQMVNSVVGREAWKPVKVMRDNFADRSNHYLQEGDKVYVSLSTGDIGVLGRQPVQNLQNLQGTVIDVINRHNVFEVDLNLQKALGGDYDGDTVFLHILQNLFGIQEADSVMRIDHRLRSAQKGGPMVGLTYNGSLAATLLTADPTLLLSRSLFLRCLTVTDDVDLEDLNTRLDKHSVPHLSGRALFSSFLPRDFVYNTASVNILNGVLVSGMLVAQDVEATMGGIVDRMSVRYGPLRAARFINDSTSALSVFLDWYGFTVNYLDYAQIAGRGRQDNDNTDDFLDAMMKPYQAEIQDKVDQARRDILSMRRGESYYERIVYDKGYKAIVADLYTVASINAFTTDQLRDNNILMLSISGAKGSMAQASQISVSLGMQYEAGNDLPMTLTNGSRITAMDIPGDLFPRARGYISGSYIGGLDPQETLSGAMSGRVSMAATNEPTKVFGAAQRDAQLALANLTMQSGGLITGNRVCIDPCMGGDPKDGEKIMSVRGTLQSISLADMIAEINAR